MFTSNPMMRDGPPDSSHSVVLALEYTQHQVPSGRRRRSSVSNRSWPPPAMKLSTRRSRAGRSSGCTISRSSAAAIAFPCGAYPSMAHHCPLHWIIRVAGRDSPDSRLGRFHGQMQEFGLLKEFLLGYLEVCDFFIEPAFEQKTDDCQAQQQERREQHYQGKKPFGLRRKTTVHLQGNPSPVNVFQFHRGNVCQCLLNSAEQQRVLLAHADTQCIAGISIPNDLQIGNALLMDVVRGWAKPSTHAST